MSTLRTGLLDELLRNTISGYIKWEAEKQHELFSGYYNKGHIIFNRLNEPDIGLDKIHMYISYEDESSDLIMASKHSKFWDTLYNLRKEVIKQTGY